MVCRSAAAAGRKAVCHAVAFPNFSLADHLHDGRALRSVRAKRWDVVVLQQGPSALDSSRKELLTSARVMHEQIKAAGSRTALLAVWPAKRRASDFPRVVESYRLAAGEERLFIPAGEAWLRVLGSPDPPAIYAEDEFHPSQLGTYLTALVVHGALFGEVPAGLAEGETARRIMSVRRAPAAGELVRLREAARAALRRDAAD